MSRYQWHWEYWFRKMDEIISLPLCLTSSQTFALWASCTVAVSLVGPTGWRQEGYSLSVSVSGWYPEGVWWVSVLWGWNSKAFGEVRMKWCIGSLQRAAPLVLLYLPYYNRFLMFTACESGKRNDAMFSGCGGHTLTKSQASIFKIYVSI